MSNAQTSLDFGVVRAAPFQEHPAGSWLPQVFPPEQYAKRHAQAETALLRIDGVAGAMLRQGIDAVRAQNNSMPSWRVIGPVPCYEMWRSSRKSNANELVAFVAHCEAMVARGAVPPGIEFKTRREHRGDYTAALCVQGAASLIVRQRPTGQVSVDFCLFREPFFLDSYRDGMAAICARETLWADACSAHRIACADKGIANVPTFAIDGRMYINDGGSGDYIYRECEGWSFSALTDWSGPTYNYREQCQAWNEGRLERGDRRGLVVRVRGELCVLDGAVTVYDDKLGEAARHGAADEGEDEQHEATDGDIDADHPVEVAV